MSIYTPDEITERKLDKMVDKLNSCIEIALDKACPMSKPKIINKNNPWWTDQLTDMRKAVTRLYKKTLIDPIQGNINAYKKKLRQYRNLCFKTKEQERKRINESVPNEEAMAKHTKKILGEVQPRLGTLQKKMVKVQTLGKILLIKCSRHITQIM